MYKIIIYIGNKQITKFIINRRPIKPLTAGCERGDSGCGAIFPF